LVHRPEGSRYQPPAASAPPSFFVGVIFERLQDSMEIANIVHQNIEAAKPVGDFGQQRFHGGSLAHVRDRDHAFRANHFDCPAHVVGAALDYLGHHDGRTGRCEALGDGAPDAGSASGY
jgi:hypothetical protein